MPTGFEFVTPAGELVSGVNLRPARIIGNFVVTTTSGSFNVSGLTGSLFAYPEIGAIHWWDTDGLGYTIASMTVSGSTISWSGIMPERVPFLVIYGECAP